MKRGLVKIGVACVGIEEGTIILTRFLPTFYRLKK